MPTTTTTTTTTSGSTTTTETTTTTSSDAAPALAPAGPPLLCSALVVESSCSLAHGGLLTAARVATGKTKHEVVLSAPAMDTLDLSGKVVLITGASRGPRSTLLVAPAGAALA